MPLPIPEPEETLPITPSAEQWLAMSRAERERFIEQVTAAMQREEAYASEGRPHFRAKVGAVTTLGEHFERIGKHVYLACELPTFYPGETPFSPDLMAVLDVEDPGDDDTRMGWVVAEEGRGLDLVLEVHYSGSKDKDLVVNVARYARLGIPEYFVYDRRAQKLYGYRLQGGRYVSIADRHGQLRSLVLGLDLGILDNRLRFFADQALIPESKELRARLEGLMDQRAARLAEVEQQVALETAAREAAERRLLTRDQQLAEALAELAALRAKLGEQAP